MARTRILAVHGRSGMALVEGVINVAFVFACAVACVVAAFLILI